MGAISDMGWADATCQMFNSARSAAPRAVATLVRLAAFGRRPGPQGPHHHLLRPWPEQSPSSRPSLCRRNTGPLLILSFSSFSSTSSARPASCPARLRDVSSKPSAHPYLPLLPVPLSPSLLETFLGNETMARTHDAHSLQSSRPPTMLSRVTVGLAATPTTAAPVKATAAAAASSPSAGRAEYPRSGPDGTDEEALWRTPAARRAERTWALQQERNTLRSPEQRRFVTAVERVLSRFDSVSEWADFIAFLTRLAKTVQIPAASTTTTGTTPTPATAAAAGGMAVPVIPHKHVVAKRLSQCLNPALPGGVHTKALEVYALILTRIGRDGLRRDLGVWTPGLLPFYAAAGLSSRSQIIDIFTRFYLPLGGDDLRPLSAAFVAAILPGLDDEAAEHSDATNRLLDELASLVGQPAFASALWLVTTQTAHVRRAALNLSLRRLPKLSTSQPCSSAELDNALGPDRGLMPRALAACLRVGGLLERRLALDVLLAKLPLSSSLFPRIGAHTSRSSPDPAFPSTASATTEDASVNTLAVPDALLLVDAAARVVLRRDVSLNRRLYAWLLGPGSGSGSGAGTGAGTGSGTGAGTGAGSGSGTGTGTGASEGEIHGQEKYLRSYTLPLLSRTLIQSFKRFHCHPSSSSVASVVPEPGEPQETHRTFIALLDKWEIGGALTAEIILDIIAAFWASAPESLRAAAIPPNDRPASSQPSQPETPAALTQGAGLETTEKMLLAAVDPHVLYTQLARSLQAEFTASNSKNHTDSPISTTAQDQSTEQPAGTALIGFILTAAPVTDDEERTVHVPAMLALLLSHAKALLAAQSTSGSSKLDKQRVNRALFAAHLALKHTAPSIFSFYHLDADTSKPSRSLASALVVLYGPAGEISLSTTKSVRSAMSAKFGAQDTRAPTTTVHSPKPDRFSDQLSSEPPSSEPVHSSQEATRTIGSEMWTPDTILEILNGAEFVVAQSLSESPPDRTLTLRATGILQGLLRALDVGSRSTGREDRVIVRWAPDQLAKIALQRLATSVEVDVVQALVEVLVGSATCRALEHPLSLRSRPAVQLIVDRLLSLLGAEAAGHVSAATSLFVSLQEAAPKGLVESCLTARLVAGPQVAPPPALAMTRHPPSLESGGSEPLSWRLGVLWLQLDERGEDATFLHAPLRVVLRGLCGPPGAAHRQIASSWIRAYVKSFARVVGPILSDALNVQVISRTANDSSSSAPHAQASTAQHKDTPDKMSQSQMFPSRICTQPADTTTLAGSVALLVGVIKEGGNPALRAMSAPLAGGASLSHGTSAFRTRAHARFGEATASLDLPPDTSLLDAAVVLGARLLATTPSRSLPPPEQAGWGAVHAAAADLLQTISARQNLPFNRIAGVLAVLVRATKRAIQERNVLIQDSLLRTLHDVLLIRVPSVVSSTGGGRDSPTESRYARRSSDEGVPLAAALDASQVAGLRHILKKGVAPHNKDALAHWSDFALSILPAVKVHTKSLLAPLAQHLSTLVERDTKLLSGQPLASTDKGPAFASDSEVAIHLALAERVVLMCVEDALPTSAIMTDTMSVRSGQRDTSSGGLLGYVTRAAAGEAATPPPEGVRATNLPLWAAELLYTFVADAQSAWNACTQLDLVSSTPRDDLVSNIALTTAVRTRARCRRALERLYRLAPADTVLSLIGSAAQREVDHLRPSFAPVLFDILFTLVASPAVAVNYVSDVVTGRRKADHLHVTDTLLLAFITSYSARLDGAGAAGVWPVIAAMGRDVLGNTAAGVPVRVVDGVLRAATALASTAAKDATFTADRRFRKDVQDQVAKVVDLSIIVAGRSLESLTSSASGSESLVGGALLFSRRPASVASNSLSAQQGGALEDADAELDNLINFVARHGFRSLRQLGVDVDRLSTSTSHAVYYLVIPALRNKARYVSSGQCGQAHSWLDTDALPFSVMLEKLRPT